MESGVRAQTEQAQPGFDAVGAAADSGPVLFAPSEADNENVRTGDTRKRNRWPFIGFGVLVTLLWSAFLVWVAVKLMELTLG